MDCIYLNRDGDKAHCHAQPIREREPLSWYVPAEGDLKQYCTSKFSVCPRLEVFHAYIKDAHK